MINLKAEVPLPDLDGIELLFFTSPNAVALFYQQPLYATCDLPVAVIGEGTKAALPDHVHCAFTGSGTTEDAAMAFVKRGFAQSLGIVISTDGRKTLQRIMKKAHRQAPWRELMVYSTQCSGKPITPCDAYLFTSPSNYLGYTMANEPPPAGQSIAIGTTTSSVMPPGTRIADGYDPNSLWNAILSALLS